jgi:glycosyltransferase involved in cell wall biosynthesis
MRILLIGEYSKLHNSLKDGLIANGHSVILISDGDGFKNYPSDYSYKAKIFSHPEIFIFTKAIDKLFKINLLKFERFVRFWFILPKLKDYDVVQLINEQSIVTYASWEIYLLKKILKKNNKLFLLSCGEDFYSLSYYLSKKPRYSILTPYFEEPENKAYKHTFRYLEKSHLKLSKFIYEKCNGIIASDMDYVAPLKGNSKFLGIIPNPINHSVLENKALEIKEKIVIFLGINSSSYVKKGIKYFELALDKIKEQYPEKVEIIINRDIPYNDYHKKLERAHIVLDQVFAFDQGYNALECMALGKVVFTGAEQEFLDFYQLNPNQVCINALPDVEKLVNELSILIESHEKILEISKNARNFILQIHDCKSIAEKYVTIWNKN